MTNSLHGVGLQYNPRTPEQQFQGYAPVTPRTSPKPAMPTATAAKLSRSSGRSHDFSIPLSRPQPSSPQPPTQPNGNGNSSNNYVMV